MPKVKKRILCVDDDPSVLSTLQQILVAEGYEAYGADDGSTALSMLEILPLPDLILSDLSMPMNGREFIVRLKQSPVLMGIPVIVVTADRNTGDLIGVVAIVEKPFQIEKLLNMLCKIL